MKKTIPAICFILVFIIPYFVMDGEDTLLDDAFRATVKGNFAELSEGSTYYRFSGPENGELLILLHGYSIPSFLWDRTINLLNQKGIRTLSYDMYGRGYSDRPDIIYNPSLFTNQLSELLKQLDIREPVYLAGISMGGAVCVDFAAKHPEKVKSLILISPYGYPQELGFMAELIKKPFIGGYMMAVAGDRVFSSRLTKNFYKTPENLNEVRSRYLEQMKIKGYKRALLSTMRHTMPVDFSYQFKEIGQSGKNVLLIWGKKDNVVPFSFSARVLKDVPQAVLKPLDDIGHSPPLEIPETTASLIEEFIKR